MHESVETAKEAVREATIGRAEKIMQNVSDTVKEVTQPAVEAVGRAAETAGATAQRVGSTVRDTGSTLVDTVRRNPVPAALIGLGLGMLFMNRRRPVAEYEGDVGYEGAWNIPAEERTGTLSRARSAAGDVVVVAQETVGAIANRTR